MTYRKFKADYLFTGKGMADSGSVLVTTAEGTVQAVIPAAEAGEDVEGYSGVLTPGFANCHCHLELSHMKGIITEGTGLVDFLLGVILRRGKIPPPADKAGLSTEELTRLAIAEGEQEMLDNGIVAVGDISNTTDTVEQKAGGRLFYHNFIEVLGFPEQDAPDKFAASLKVFNAFAEAYTLPVGGNSMVPHAPYTVSPALFRLLADVPGSQVITIHNQETEAENTFSLSGEGDFQRLYRGLGMDVSFFRGTGKRSLASYLPYFHKNQNLILVHNVDTKEEDLLAAGVGGGVAGARGSALAGTRGPNLYFCLCPNANVYISRQLPDVDLLIRYGCDIVLGTDSLTSNHQLSILEEMKTLQRSFPQLSTPTLLQWATSNGARALQMESVLGSFVPGKRPGVVLIQNLEGDRLTEKTRAKRLV